ncbi:MAG TPA: hypothetical protein VFG54_11835 [Prolixibacteraceae bacterium]|nr:hypothetical protein [Prolixibacteraceae bacterium]
MTKSLILTFLFIALTGIPCLYAQDFVQPIKRDPVRIKNPRTEQKDKRTKRVEVKEFDYQHFKLSVNTGYSEQISRMAERIPTPLTEYLKDLKSGNHFGLDFRYYPVEPVGFGIKYLAFNSRSSKAIVTSPSKYSILDKDLSLHFIGPSISARYLHADMKNSLYFNIACGYVGYRVNYRADVDFYARGNTMATVNDFGYDLGLNQNVGVGFQISYFRGILKEYKRTYEGETQNVYLEYGKYERLHRLDFSIGLKLNL